MYVCERECVSEWVFVSKHVCAHLLESWGESHRDLVDISVAVGREGIWFYPFLFLNLGDRVGLFLYNPYKEGKEMRRGKLLSYVSQPE